MLSSHLKDPPHPDDIVIVYLPEQPTENKRSRSTTITRKYEYLNLSMPQIWFEMLWEQIHEGLFWVTSK